MRVHVLSAMFQAITLALLTAPAAADGGRAPGGGGEAPGGHYEQLVRPLIQQYCLDCHSGDDPQAGIALDRFVDEPAALAGGEVWFRVLDALESRIMPPDDMPQPGADAISLATRWIEGDFLQAQCGTSPGPAPVVVRRLNRHEYNNTIRDLLGLDLRPADDFPQDEIGFGFDNVGAALTVSPSHIEKYLEAAERVAEAAIATPDVEGLSPAELIGLQPYRLKRGEPAEFEHEFTAGRYLADVTVPGKYDASAPPALTIGFGTDRRTVVPVVVRPESLIYRLWLTAADGKNTVSLALPPGPGDKDDVAATDAVEAPVPERRSRPQDGEPEGPYGRDPDTFVVDSIVIRGPARIEPDRLPISHRTILFSTPQIGEESRADCARRVIAPFAERAFRRPLRAGELQRLLDVFRLADERGESFERAVQVLVSTILVSPQFLYLLEPEPATEDRLLTEFELASRLSYFLWSSLPDDELFEQARQGTLRRNLRSQAARMLADPKSDAFVENLTGQWLQLRKLDGVAPDRQLFPTFDNALRGAMREETERFFAHILRNDRSVLELLDADYTFLNERLARHYGIAGVEGSEFRQAALGGGPRGGLLTQASVLTLTSNPNRTSPVKRGQWILEQLLGTPPPPPPPDIEPLDDSRDAMQAASLRERLERHRANPECAACHNRMDPLGFALENFDATGRWRATDSGFAIEPAGRLTDGRAFADAGALKQLLKSQPKLFCRCLIENMLTYALGRGLELNDRCTVEEIRRKLVEQDYRISTIIVGIIESPQFQHRGVSRATPLEGETR